MYELFTAVQQNWPPTTLSTNDITFNWPTVLSTVVNCQNFVIPLFTHTPVVRNELIWPRLQSSAKVATSEMPDVSFLLQAAPAVAAQSPHLAADPSDSPFILHL